MSLAAAILVAVPLGILAARPRAAQAILGVVGVLQTIPSLALLVFMIPLLGIGAPPAMVALFLYSLLPIVRNTHAGLQGIPGAARVGRGARPAAVRAAAPGRAADGRPRDPRRHQDLGGDQRRHRHLGALIGAGGYGQPILTGIRLDDIGLILEGAVPAAVLALLVQGVFEIAERLVVPRGLRLRPQS